MADLRDELNDYLSKNNDRGPLLPNVQKFMSFPAEAPSWKKWWPKFSVPHDEQGYGWFQRTKVDCCPSMNRAQRVIGFVFCLMMGCICFGIAALYTPLLLLKARKFALLFTLGNVCFMVSLSFLWGPVSHMRHLFSKEQLSITLPYVGTLFGTLYFALGPKSTPLTVLFATLQIITLLWYVIKSVPGLSFITRIFSSKVVSKSLPV